MVNPCRSRLPGLAAASGPQAAQARPAGRNGATLGTGSTPKAAVPISRVCPTSRRPGPQAAQARPTDHGQRGPGRNRNPGSTKERRHPTGPCGPRCGRVFEGPPYQGPSCKLFGGAAPRSQPQARGIKGRPAPPSTSASARQEERIWPTPHSAQPQARRLVWGWPSPSACRRCRRPAAAVRRTQKRQHDRHEPPPDAQAQARGPRRRPQPNPHNAQPQARRLVEGSAAHHPPMTQAGNPARARRAAIPAAQCAHSPTGDGWTRTR